MGKVCIYCSCSPTVENPITNDHVPPKLIFKNLDISEQRITVPCCLRCNQFYSKHENKVVIFFDKVLNDSLTPEETKEYLVTNPNITEVIKKIAIGYKYNWDKTHVNNLDINRVEYLVLGVDDNLIKKFKSTILEGNVSRDLSCISHTGKLGVPYLVIFENNNEVISFVNESNIYNEHFWHYYDKENNTIKFSFYEKIFIQVYF